MAEDTPGDDTTTDTDVRWSYTGTALSALLLTSLVMTVVGAAAGGFSLSAIPETWALMYSIVVLMAATWVFGRETFNAVKEFRE